MKPFNLEEARKGAPICTRDGQTAEFIAYVPKGEALSRVIVLVGNKVFQLSTEGFAFTNLQSDIDLFMAPQKRTVWVNFYENSTLSLSANVHATEEGANRAVGQHDSRLGCKAFPVEIEL